MKPLMNHKHYLRSKLIPAPIGVLKTRQWNPVAGEAYMQIHQVSRSYRTRSMSERAGLARPTARRMGAL